MNIGNEDFTQIVQHLIRGGHACLNSLDVSNNRISGIEGGKAIAALMQRKPMEYGVDLEYLNVSHNKIGNKGATLIFIATINENCTVKTLKLQ